MPADTRKFTPRRAALRPDALTKEAKTWASVAKAARDPGTKQEFEDMAERRVRVAQAVEALANDPPMDDAPQPLQPDKAAKKT